MVSLQEKLQDNRCKYNMLVLLHLYSLYMQMNRNSELNFKHFFMFSKGSTASIR